MTNETNNKNSSVKENNLLDNLLDNLVKIAFIILAITVFAMFATLIFGFKLEDRTISLISTITAVIACILTFLALSRTIQSVEIAKQTIDFDINLSIEERKHKIIIFSSESIKLLERIRIKEDNPENPVSHEVMSKFIMETRMLESYPFYRAEPNKAGFTIVNSYRTFLLLARSSIKDSIKNNENKKIDDFLAQLKNTHTIMLQALESGKSPQEMQEKK